MCVCVCARVGARVCVCVHVFVDLHFCSPAVIIIAAP